MHGASAQSLASVTSCLGTDWLFSIHSPALFVLPRTSARLFELDQCCSLTVNTNNVVPSTLTISI